jgi:hypothetical protein
MADYTKEVPERFRINFNRMQGAFYILDMWHETVRSLPGDAVIPDNSPAMKIVSSLEVNALLGTLKEMGWLDKLVESTGPITQSSSFKSLQEISMENITAIVQSDKDAGVTKEAISAIRDIMNKV